MTVAANIPHGHGTAPAANLGYGIPYFDQADGKLYYRNSVTGAITGPIVPSAGGGAVANEVIYLELPANGGNDGTGTRGDSSKPFATYAAALAAAQDGDEIRVGVGLFSEGVAPVWPVGVTHLTITGSGRPADVSVGMISGTAIVWTVPGGGIVPPSTVRQLLVQHLSLDATGGAYPAYCDGTGGGGLYMRRGCVFRDVRLEGSLGAGSWLYVSNLVLDDVQIVQPSIEGIVVHTCNGHFNNVNAPAGWCYFGWDDDSAQKPLVGRSEFAMFNTRIGNSLTGLGVYGQPELLLERSFFSTIKEDYTHVPAGITEAGSGANIALTCRSVLDDVYLDLLPDSIGGQKFDFTGSQFTGSGGVYFKRAGIVNGRTTIPMQGIISTEFQSVTADDGVDIIWKSTAYPSLTTILSGTIKPNEFLITVSSLAAGPTAVPFGFTAPSAPIYVFAQSGKTGAQAGLGVRSSTTTSVTVDAAFASNIFDGPASILIKWPV